MLDEEGLGMVKVSSSRLGTQLVPVLRVEKKVSEDIDKVLPVIGDEFAAGVIGYETF